MVANSGSGDVSVLLGNGDGTFQPARSVPVGSSPQSVALGDFKGDGRIDLAVGQGYPHATSLQVLLGNGDGTFGSPTAYGVGGLAPGLVVGDFNEDGLDDVAGALGNAVFVALGRSGIAKRRPVGVQRPPAPARR